MYIPRESFPSSSEVVAQCGGSGSLRKSGRYRTDDERPMMAVEVCESNIFEARGTSVEGTKNGDVDLTSAPIQLGMPIRTGIQKNSKQCGTHRSRRLTLFLSSAADDEW